MEGAYSRAKIRMAKHAMLRCSTMVQHMAAIDAALRSHIHATTTASRTAPGHQEHPLVLVLLDAADAPDAVLLLLELLPGPLHLLGQPLPDEPVLGLKLLG